MVKKLTALLLAILTLFILCGCNISPSGQADEKSGQEHEEKENKKDISYYTDIGYHLELTGLSKSQYTYLKEYKGENGVFDEVKQLYVIVDEETVSDKDGKEFYNICIRFGKEKNISDAALTCKYYSDFLYSYCSALQSLSPDNVISHKKTELLTFILTESKTAVYSDLLLYGTAEGLLVNTHIIIDSLTKDQYDTLAGTSESPLASIFSTKKYSVHYDGTNSDGTYYVHISLGDSTNIADVYDEYIDFMYNTLTQLEVPSENIFLTEDFRSSAFASN